MKVVVTGIASDFGTAIAPRLFADKKIEEVLGIDLREPRVAHAKLGFEREDVRSQRMEELFAGAEVVVHLAYIVGEVHDRELIHDVNIGGSQNVIHAADAAGVKRLVVASSVSAYGTHENLPGPLDENEFPRGSPDRYYFYDKAEVEHYIEWWERRNPKSKLVITRLRPPTIIGPSVDNDLVRLLAAGVSVYLRPAHPIQFLHERDLATAFHAAVAGDAPGPFNISTGDCLDVAEMAKLHGQRLFRFSRRFAKPVMDIAFRLHLSPESGQWATPGDPLVNSERARRGLKWQPEFSSLECAHIHLMQRGRPILPGKGRDASGQAIMKRKAVAEATLEPITSTLKEWVEQVDGLKRAVGEPAEIDRFVGRLQHDFVPYKDRNIHLEVHPAESGRATVVFSPGLGAYARFYLPLLGKLCDAGLNAVGIDRPGHGLSEGRRGDCSLQATLDVVEESIRYARDRFGGPIVLSGSSLGGIITWLALTREPDIDAAICHNIAHPEVFHEPAARLKAPFVRKLGRLVPHARIPIGQIADFDEVTQSAVIGDWIDERRDKLFAWNVSASFPAELLDYSPSLDWPDVTTPTLVLVGTEDRMVSQAFTQAALDRATPANAELRPLSGLGHLIFHDHLAESLPVFLEYVEDKLGSGEPLAVSG